MVSKDQGSAIKFCTSKETQKSQEKKQSLPLYPSSRYPPIWALHRVHQSQRCRFRFGGFHVPSSSGNLETSLDELFQTFEQNGIIFSKNQEKIGNKKKSSKAKKKKTIFVSLLTSPGVTWHRSKGFFFPRRFCLGHIQRSRQPSGLQ